MAACDLLTGGIDLSCDNNVGGIKKIRFTEKSNVSSITLTSDEISAFNMAGSPPAKFYNFQFNKNTSSYTQEISYDQATGRKLTTITINLVLNRREKAKRDKLLLLGQLKDMVAIITDNNDINWYAGETFGINLTTEGGGSGVTKTDANQYVVTFVGEEPKPMNTATAAAVTAVSA